MLFLDSDALIDLLHGAPAVMALLHAERERGEELATSSINVAEVQRGAHHRPAEHAAVTLILGGLTEVPFGPRAARRFGRLMHAMDKAGRPVPELDGMIAAVVLESAGRLLTGNQRHFRHIAGLEVVPLRS